MYNDFELECMYLVSFENTTKTFQLKYVHIDFGSANTVRMQLSVFQRCAFANWAYVSPPNGLKSHSITQETMRSKEKQKKKEFPKKKKNFLRKKKNFLTKKKNFLTKKRIFSRWDIR